MCAGSGSQARPLYHHSVLGAAQLLSPRPGLFYSWADTTFPQPASSSALRGHHFRCLGSGLALKVPAE